MSRALRRWWRRSRPGYRHAPRHARAVPGQLALAADARRGPAPARRRGHPGRSLPHRAAPRWMSRDCRAWIARAGHRGGDLREPFRGGRARARTRGRGLRPPPQRRDGGGHRPRPPRAPWRARVRTRPRIGGDPRGARRTPLSAYCTREHEPWVFPRKSAPPAPVARCGAAWCARPTCGLEATHLPDVHRAGHEGAARRLRACRGSPSSRSMRRSGGARGGQRAVSAP